jgi:hypothetical protein
MALKIKVPRGYKPKKPPYLKEGHLPDTQFWIYAKDGTSKKYAVATSAEVYLWATDLTDDPLIADESRLNLLVIRNVVLNRCLELAMAKHEGLFGAPESWSAIPGWKQS